jgi:hypothetical protein
VADHIKKVERWERMVEITEGAHDAMRAAILPIAEHFGRVYCIDSIERWPDGVITIRHTDHCSGGPYGHETRIPLKVWTADDPVAAAREYAQERKDAASKAERQRKLDEIDRLTRELSKEPSND